MATKTLSAALSALAADGTISGSERIIVADTDGTARTITVNQLINQVSVPTLQTSANGASTNYIYSSSTDASKAVLCGVYKVYQYGGKCKFNHKIWGGTKDYSDGKYFSTEIPTVTTSSEGAMNKDVYARLLNHTIVESGSTTEAVKVNYTNFNTGGNNTLTLSKATTAKAGVMTADDKVKLDALYANALELGNYPSEEDALNALADLSICANAKIVHAHLTYEGGNMSITMVQSISNDYTRQIIYNKEKIFQRGIYFTDANRSAIKSKEDWGCLFGDRMEWDRGENKYVLSQFGLTFNKDHTDPIPTATTNNDGLMSAADKQLLEQIKAKLNL